MQIEPQTKTCQNCKADFTIEPEDFEFYEKMQVPPPTWCPQCRMVRRFMWRNERTLYQRNCDLCQAVTISVFRPDSTTKVYCNPCWWSEKWDALDYGVDYDPSRSFIDQIQELLARVPVMALYSVYTTLDNSDYVNMAGYLKDCYLSTHIDHSERCLYANIAVNSKDCVDCLMVLESELCYESVNCSKCYETLYSLDCISCNSVYYSRNCVGCSNCFGCVNLRNKNYCIFNEQYIKEEYKKKVVELMSSTPKSDEDPRKLWNLYPQKYMHERQNSDVSGDYIYGSKNVHNGFIVYGVEDSRYCAFMNGGKDCYDVTNYAETSELLYETLQSGDHTSRIRWSWIVVSNAMNIDYSMLIVGGKDIIGSIGLKKKKNCILNKQYSKDGYEALRAKIEFDMKERGEWGEFFPANNSPFAYNETSAQEYFPMSQEEAEANRYRWYENKRSIHRAGEGAYACEDQGECTHNCTGAFRLIPAELTFYKKLGLSIPRYCPNCRHGRRVVWRTPITTTVRHCMCRGKTSGAYTNTAEHVHGTAPCPNTFQTSYAPERPEIVYCEKCYQAEVI